MADHTITVRNSIGLVGGKPAQFWGPTMTWGTSTWGNKPDFFEMVVMKLIANALTLNDPAFAFSVLKDIAESLALTDNQFKAMERLIAESLTLAGDSSSQTLQDRVGYFYVFPRPTTNNETRIETSYTSLSASSQSFTSQANTSTVWS